MPVFTQVCVLVPAKLHPNAAGLLEIDVAVALADAIVIVTVDVPDVLPVQAGGVGERPVLHGSVPTIFTVAVGEPDAVANVQLPEPGLLGIFREAITAAVVWPDAFVTGIGPPRPAFVQVPVSCAPATGVPFPFKRVNVTGPPSPPSCEGVAKSTRSPLATIGTTAD